MIKVVCTLCGKEVSVIECRKDTFKYCSKKCSDESKKAPDNCKWGYCGKPFHLKNYRIKRCKVNYCSKECNILHRAIRYKGSGNHQYGLKGELNDSFKRDWKISGYGYILLRCINHPNKDRQGLVFAHRLVIEEYLNTYEPTSYYLEGLGKFKYLKREYIVHHINENKIDNRVCNLKVMTLSEHTSLHDTIRHGRGRYMKNKVEGKFKDTGVKLSKEMLDNAGLDICSNEDITVPSRDSVIISTNLFLEIPSGHVGLIWSRSGLSTKHKLEVGAGCIDSNYRGEVKVHLYNFSDVDYSVKVGDRIAQLLTIPVFLEAYKPVEQLRESDRGEKGFGSSGV